LEKLRGRSKVQMMVKTDTPAQAVPPADAPKATAAAPAPPQAPVTKGAVK
jgi:hypothetical protein